MENQRKRVLAEPLAGAPSIKKEPVESDEKVENCPILTSMISAPVASPVIPKPPPTINYLMVFAAFRRFLNAYLEAGGDVNLANTLANYSSSLPMPPNPLKPLTSSGAIPEVKSDQKSVDEKEKCAESEKKPLIASPSILPLMPRIMAPPPAPVQNSALDDEVTSEIQRLREAAFGRYKNVLCVICNEWICSRNRKNHIEAHLNYRPYKCSACDYARRREIFVVQHIKTHHEGQEGVEMLNNVDLAISVEVDRLADECVARTRKLIESMQEKKDGEFGVNQDFDEKAAELMLAEEKEKKVVVIESVSEVRAKVANYHRRQRTSVLKKIYDTDMAKGAQLKIVKDQEEGAGPSSQPNIGMHVEEGFEIKLEDLMAMIAAGEQKEKEEETLKNKEPEPAINIKQELADLQQ